MSRQQCPAAYNVSGQILICLKITTQTQRSLRISLQLAWYRAPQQAVSRGDGLGVRGQGSGVEGQGLGDTG